MAFPCSTLAPACLIGASLWPAAKPVARVAHRNRKAAGIKRHSVLVCELNIERLVDVLVNDERLASSWRVTPDNNGERLLLGTFNALCRAMTELLSNALARIGVCSSARA